MKNDNKRVHLKVRKRNGVCYPNMEKTLALAHEHENHSKWKKTKKQNVGRQRGKQA